MPESALTTTKEKKLSGRQWFESGRHTMVYFSGLISSLYFYIDSDINPINVSLSFIHTWPSQVTTSLWKFFSSSVATNRFVNFSYSSHVMTKPWSFLNRKVQIQLPRSLKRKRKISSLMTTLKVIIYPKFSFLQSEFNYGKHY